jgi:sugar phosphate isomerase/epimerase
MSLRLAYNTNGAANHRLDDALILIADAGYDGVALTLDHHHHDPFAPDWERQTERLRQRLADLHLGSVIETGARYLLDPREKHEPTLLNPTREGRAWRVEFLQRAVDIAAMLGSETVSFWAGVPKPGVPREQALTWLKEGLAQVCDHAAERGVIVSLEPEPGMLVETVADYRALVPDAPTLRLALDTGHCLVTQDIAPDAAVRAHANRLGTVAIEDMRLGDHTHLPFGEGDMDVPAVVAALHDIAFTGLVCVEYSRESPRAHLAIAEAIASLRAAGA